MQNGYSIRFAAMLQNNSHVFVVRFTVALLAKDVFTFGGAKRSDSDRECKYFPIGMNAREPLWR